MNELYTLFPSEHEEEYVRKNLIDFTVLYQSKKESFYFNSLFNKAIKKQLSSKFIIQQLYEEIEKEDYKRSTSFAKNLQEKNLKLDCFSFNFLVEKFQHYNPCNMLGYYIAYQENKTLNPKFSETMLNVVLDYKDKGGNVEFIKKYILNSAKKEILKNPENRPQIIFRMVNDLITLIDGPYSDIYYYSHNHVVYSSQIKKINTILSKELTSVEEYFYKSQQKLLISKLRLNARTIRKILTDTDRPTIKKIHNDKVLFEKEFKDFASKNEECISSQKYAMIINDYDVCLLESILTNQTKSTQKNQADQDKNLNMDK